MSQRIKYRNKNPIYRFFVNRFLRRITKAVDSISVNKILDVACSEGSVIEYLRNHNSNFQFKGLDIDAEAILEAEKINPGIKFKCMDIYDIKNETDEFDLIMILEVLEHLDRYEKVLDDLYNLKSKYFLFSVPHEPFFRSINFLRGRYWSRFGNIPEHVNTWSKKRFKKLIAKNFVIQMDYSCFPWTIILATKK